MHWPWEDPDKKEESAIVRAILLSAYKIVAALNNIADAIRGTHATILTLHYTLEGRFTMGQPITNATPGQTYNPTVVESNPTTPSIPPIGPLVYATDNAAVCTVDSASGVVVTVAPGIANISVLDQGNGLTDSVAFTVSAAPPPGATNLALSYKLA